MKSDAELVTAALGGHRASFTTLVERCQRAAYAQAAAVLRDHHAAQDVTQEVFLAAYQQLARLRNRGAFGTWILRMARHEALRAWRARQRASEARNRPSAVCESADPWITAASDRLLTAIAELPENERRAVMMMYFDGRSAEAIAAIVGRPVGTVTKWLSRAYADLRATLKGLDP